jgi:hypothetical protein
MGAQRDSSGPGRERERVGDGCETRAMPGSSLCAAFASSSSRIAERAEAGPASSAKPVRFVSRAARHL